MTTVEPTAVFGFPSRCIRLRLWRRRIRRFLQLLDHSSLGFGLEVCPAVCPECSYSTSRPQTIGQLADEIRRGIVKPSNVPVEFVNRVVDGKKVRLIVNTRSSLALKRAGVPESIWNLIDKTADQRVQWDITTQLMNNGLADEGVAVLRMGTRGRPPK